MALARGMPVEDADRDQERDDEDHGRTERLDVEDDSEQGDAGEASSGVGVPPLKGGEGVDRAAAPVPLARPDLEVQMAAARVAGVARRRRRTGRSRRSGPSSAVRATAGACTRSPGAAPWSEERCSSRRSLPPAVDDPGGGRPQRASSRTGRRCPVPGGRASRGRRRIRRRTCGRHPTRWGRPGCSRSAPSGWWVWARAWWSCRPGSHRRSGPRRRRCRAPWSAQRQVRPRRTRRGSLICQVGLLALFRWAYGVSWRARAERAALRTSSSNSPQGTDQLHSQRFPRSPPVGPEGIGHCWRGSIAMGFGGNAVRSSPPAPSGLSPAGRSCLAIMPRLPRPSAAPFL